MKTCKRCQQNKPASAFRPDPRYRDGLGSWCIACHRDRSSAWAKQNRALLTAKAAERRIEKPDATRAADRKWKAANKDKTAARFKKWRMANKEYDCARAAARKAKKLQATPSWANQSAIAEIYKLRPTGHEVDHIVPLVSPIVCGLHCEANLQYLPSSANQSKRNFYWPDMPVENAQRQARMFA